MSEDLIPVGLKQKLDNLNNMGFMETESLKSDVIASTLDNQTKFYAIDLIDNRLSSLNIFDAIAVYDEDIGID